MTQRRGEQCVQHPSGRRAYPGTGSPGLPAVSTETSGPSRVSIEEGGAKLRRAERMLPEEGAGSARDLNEVLREVRRACPPDGIFASGSASDRDMLQTRQGSPALRTHSPGVLRGSASDPGAAGGALLSPAGRRGRLTKPTVLVPEPAQHSTTRSAKLPSTLPGAGCPGRPRDGGRQEREVGRPTRCPP